MRNSEGAVHIVVGEGQLPRSPQPKTQSEPYFGIDGTGNKAMEYKHEIGTEKTC